MATILVTGGAGYIGSHACKALAEAGHRPVSYDNLCTGWRDAVQFGPFELGDIRDTDRLIAVMKAHNPDAVLHFAALIEVGASVKDPSSYWSTNVLGSKALLDAMQATETPKLVFSSTCATYGIPQKMPMDETTPQSPINPYGWSKLFVEKILDDYDRAHGIKSVKLRYFNAAGADPDGEIGERHEPETHLIPLALKGAGDPDYTLNILGADYDTRDGSAIRDYIHVVDLADAHLRALDYLAGGGATTQINLGTGTGTSVIEIRDSVEKITGCKVNSKLAPRRPGDPAKLIAVPEKAKALLGWVPKNSGVDQLIEGAWAWHQAELARATPEARRS